MNREQRGVISIQGKRVFYSGRRDGKGAKMGMCSRGSRNSKEIHVASRRRKRRQKMKSGKQ
jgi:hypothetical protein